MDSLPTFFTHVRSINLKKLFFLLILIIHELSM
nr:MAG TPA: hypothetical protein [Bacteriophage sp.]